MTDSLLITDGDWTGREIAQQPDVWTEALANLDRVRPALEVFLAPLLAQDDLRIILTGAGSSAFVGRTAAPVLTRALDRLVEAIATTDLVAAPLDYLLPRKPTLLVSFGRSGDSPESVAAVKLADQLVENCWHLTISCNPTGALALHARDNPRSFSLLMPAATLDRSFAMTSSFSSMLLTSIAAFAPDAVQAQRTIALARTLLGDPAREIDAAIALGFERIAFLGSGALSGIATEAALKMLELSSGRVDCYADTPLGFRHGPKFVLDERTLVVMLDSIEPYTHDYDDDLAREVTQDGRALQVIRLGELPYLQGGEISDVWLTLIYLIWCQRLARRHALALNIDPDSPSADGQVNRVVQGVTIYAWPDRQP